MTVRRRVSAAGRNSLATNSARRATRSLAASIPASVFSEETTMNLEQLTAFAISDEQHIRQLALTRSGARQLVAEIRALLGDEPKVFEINTERCDAKPYSLLR